MRDMMSSGLVQLARTSQTQLGRVQHHVDSLVNSNKKLGDSFDSVERKAKSAGTNLTQYTRNLAASVGVAATVAGLLGFATQSVRAAANYGATEKSFGVLTGSASIGKSLSGDLNKLQQDTILGTEVFKNAQTMLGFGITAKEVLPDIRMLGAVAMGNAEKFGALTLAFSQVRAAGRLTGQDLLQFVNAGFNPLQEISAKTGRSMADLRKDMENGLITFGMVEGAFKSATSEGGKFNGMLEAMADTTYGRMQLLSGAYEKFKIDVGNALIPVAEGLMDAAQSTLSFLNISKSVPEVLAGERAEISGLVSMITTLNIGNRERATLLDTLVKKYPDLFGAIDKEKITNEQLLGTLRQINGLYKERIELAGTQALKDSYGNREQEQLKEVIRLSGIVKALTMGDNMGAKSLSPGWERFAAGAYGNELEFYKTKLSTTQSYYEHAKKQRELLEGPMRLQQKIVDAADAKAMAPEIIAFLSQKGNLPAQDADRFKELQRQMKMGGGLSSGMIAFIQATKNRMSPGNITPGATVTSGTGADDKTATGKAIAAGGPRTINIHGVNMKVADTIQLSVSNAQDFVNELEPQMKEMLLRLLNSGAAVQG